MTSEATSVIDHLIDTVRELGGSEPVLIEINGNLLVVSENNVVGEVNYGLALTNATKMDGSPINETKPDGLEQTIISGEYEPKPDDTIEKERPYLNAIPFERIRQDIKLETLSKLAKNISELPNDGKVRIVNYGENSRSSGYDGRESWTFIKEAFTLDRETYLELVREKEKETYTNLIQLGSDVQEEKSHNNVSNMIFSRPAPSCAILTGNIFVSLPRSGHLNTDRYNIDNWNKESRIKSDEYDSNIINDLAKTIQNGDVSIKINAQSLSLNKGNISEQKGTLLGQIDKEISIVQKHMPGLSQYVNQVKETYVTAERILDLRSRGK
jgi:hypothetical protein